MSENCSNNCSACGEECSERKAEQMTEKTNELSNIKKVYGIVSGKGGVGKSLVMSMLAIAMNAKGYHTAILDADITGPSIPKAFGLRQRATGSDLGLFPVESKKGIKIMSLNLLVENETDPVIWRGPIIGNTVKQFWTDVIWGDIDFMFIDMPPGTGDVPLTVFQSVPVNGIIIVTSPQELVSMIVSKAANMAKMMNIPILGLVENMSYVKCPDCGKEIKVFGESHIQSIAAQLGIPHTATLPLDPVIARACDLGTIETVQNDRLDSIAGMLETLN